MFDEKSQPAEVLRRMRTPFVWLALGYVGLVTVLNAVTWLYPPPLRSFDYVASQIELIGWVTVALPLLAVVAAASTPRLAVAVLVRRIALAEYAAMIALQASAAFIAAVDDFKPSQTFFWPAGEVGDIAINVANLTLAALAAVAVARMLRPVRVVGDALDPQDSVVINL